MCHVRRTRAEALMYAPLRARERKRERMRRRGAIGANESEGERKSGLHAAYAPKFICAAIKPLSPFSSLTATPFDKERKKREKGCQAPLHGNIAAQWAAHGKWPTIPLRYFALRACTLISRVSSIFPTLRSRYDTRAVLQG